MKKLFALIISLVIASTSAIAETIIDWSQYTDIEIETIIDEAYDELDRRMDGNYVSSLLEDDANASSLNQGLIDLIKQDSVILDNASIDSVTVNANYGTTRSGDYIALIYMTYTGNHGTRNDGSFLVTMSDRIGAIVEKNYAEINELVVFWDLPNYDSSAKATFSLKDGKMSFEDMYWPKVISDAWY